MDHLVRGAHGVGGVGRDELVRGARALEARPLVREPRVGCLELRLV
jgi:hypothetical protein